MLQVHSGRMMIPIIDTVDAQLCCQHAPLSWHMVYLSYKYCIQFGYCDTLADYFYFCFDPQNAICTRAVPVSKLRNGNLETPESTLSVI